MFDPLKRFIRVAQASLQVLRLDRLEDLAKFRARLKTERDQIITTQQRQRNDRLVSEFFALALAKIRNCPECDDCFRNQPGAAPALR